MATLKSKRKQKEVIEELATEVENSAPVEAEPEEVEEIPVSLYMNQDEQTALAEQHERDTAESKKVSIAKMERAVEVASDSFNLYGHDYVVNGFADKGSKCQLSMSNNDFDIVITIKDAEKFGIV